MSEAFHAMDEKCLLLAYYFGRIKLLNCVALYRITKDLITACETTADNNSTKYSEPLDGCCLCEEKEILYKELLEKHGQGSRLPSSDDRHKIDLEKAWADVSELWRNNVAKKDELGHSKWSQDTEQSCQNLIKKHGLKVFGDQEYSHASFLSHWEALIKSVKKKIKACRQSVATINGSATMPSNPGPNVTKWTMRNAYFFLVKKKCARQQAKFMQSCRKVGIQIRAAREPLSVLARFTMCTLCTKMGNKHKVLEVSRLLKNGLSYLSYPIAIDEDPDVEPIFGRDDPLKNIGKMSEKTSANSESLLPGNKQVVQSESGTNLATLRRSDRTPVVKKKNESFLYYANKSIKNVDSTSATVKKRRASLPVLVSSPVLQTVATKATFPAVIDVNECENKSNDDSLNVVIVTADSEQSETVVPNEKMAITPSTSGTLQSVMLNGPNKSLLKIVPVTTMSNLTQTLNISPLTVEASALRQCTVTRVCNSIAAKDLRPSLNPSLQAKGNLASNETLQRPFRTYRNQTVGNSDLKKAPGVIPITPTSLAQLLSSQKSRRVFFFPANSASGAGIEFRKPSVIPLTLTQSGMPSSRPRSVSLDSCQQKKPFVQSIKREVPVVTTPKVTKVPVNTPKKSPLFVQIVNGRIQRPGGMKVGASPTLKSIPLAGNHVKFVKSVSLKNGRKFIPTIVKPETTVKMKKTLVLGGNLKQGSIMRVGSSPREQYRSSTNRQFQLGKSFTFKTIKPAGEVKKPTPDIVLKKHALTTNPPLPHENKHVIMPTSMASKKPNPSYLHSPVRTPGKKKHTRPPSKSMATVVAEHILSLMPSSVDEDLWKKLNSKNKRRSEKSSALIPVPYEINFLCIHDTIERYGWKSYWYWKCRCSKVREKAAETDPEYSEPNPADIAAWIPEKVTDVMRKTLTNYVESDDRALAMPTYVSPPKFGSVARVLLADYLIKNDRDQTDKLKKEKDESENVDVESIEDAIETCSDRKRKSSDGIPEQGRKTSSVGIIAKYRKDKNGNWTALSNFDQAKEPVKSESEVETLSQSSLDSSVLGDNGNQEDSVMLNIQPGPTPSPCASALAMEDRVGTTNDHGLRRCARVTMIRRKALVRRALDAEMRFRAKRERTGSSASEIFLCSSFRYGSLTDPNFTVITAHPLCFREEQDVYLKVTSIQEQRHRSRQELLHAKNSDEVPPQQSCNTEDSIMSLLSRPTCSSMKEKLRNTPLRNSNPVSLKTKPPNSEHNKSGELAQTVMVRSKNTSECATASSSSKSNDSAAETWNFSDRSRKVVNKITQDVAFSDLQVLRGIPATQSPSNVISRWNAEFITRALQGSNDMPLNLNPVVVLPAPTFTFYSKNVERLVISEPEKLKSPPVESLPPWMKNARKPPVKVKCLKNKIRHVVAKVAVPAHLPSESSPPVAVEKKPYGRVTEEKNPDRSIKEANVGPVDSFDDNCLEISIQKVYSLSTPNSFKFDTSDDADCSPPGKMSKEIPAVSKVIPRSLKLTETNGEYDRPGSARCGVEQKKSIVNTGQTGKVSSDMDKSFVILDRGLDELSEDAASNKNLGKEDFGGIIRQIDALKSKENENCVLKNELQKKKIQKTFEYADIPSTCEKKPTNYVPNLFTIHRDLRTMLKMSKRGSLAHLSLSGTKEDSTPFKNHLRRKFKGNRNLSVLLGRNYDLKRIASQFKDKTNESKKRLSANSAQRAGKSPRVKRKKSTGQRPLSNMFNWIWDANDVENAKLAKYMPTAANVKSLAVENEPASRESTPETTRGQLLSKMTNSASKLKNFLPGGDVGVCPSPQTEEAGTPSEVSEVQLPEPSPSSSPTSPRHQRKRRPEGSHTLDGMYWTDLMDYDGVDQHAGKKLRRRRILSDEHCATNKEQVNKRKRQGVGFRMSSFDHTREILNVDNESIKKCNREKSTAWEDEDTYFSDPMHNLFSRALNVERLRLWIWDSTSPRPMQLLTQEQRKKRKRREHYKHRHASLRTISLDVDSPYRKISGGYISGSDEGCPPHNTIPFIRCSVPPEDSDSDSERPTEKRVFLIRRKASTEKDAGAVRPKGLSNQRSLKRKQKFDFFSYFEKTKKEKCLDVQVQKSSVSDGNQPPDAPTTLTSEPEVVIDVDEGGKPIDVKMEPELEYNLGQSPESPRNEGIAIDDCLPDRKNRYCPRKKSDSHLAETDTDSAKIPKKRKRRSDVRSDDVGETKLQALRETVFMELKQKGNFRDKNSTSDSSNSASSSGIDRRRPLLQSRCSTKGTFISRLLECDTECMLPDDAAKT